MPDYARNAHGNLADQNRSFGPVRGIKTGGRLRGASGGNGRAGSAA
jgi:hypothetical protein